MKYASLIPLAVLIFLNQVSGSHKINLMSNLDPSLSNARKKISLLNKVKNVTDQKSIEVLGNQRISQPRIEAIIGTVTDPKKISDLLVSSGLFKTVKVSAEHNKLKIIVQENPVISKITFNAKGTYFIENKVFLENLNIKVGDIFNKEKLNRASEIVRQITINMTGIEKVRVKIKQILEPNNQIRIRFEVFVEQGTRIRRAKFIGNKKLTSGELYRNLHKIRVLQHPIPFIAFQELNQLNLYEHKQCLEKYAASRGFLDFKVQNISIVEDHFTILVEEGDQYRINKVTVVNECPELDINLIRKYSNPLQAGDICNVNIIQYVKNKILKALIDRGLNRYRVTVGFEKKGQTVDLEVKVYFDTAAFKVNRIVVKDNFKVREDVIRDKFKIQPGDYINEDVLKYYQQRVEHLQPINSLKNDLKSHDDHDLDIFGASEENPFESMNPNMPITSMKAKAIPEDRILELSVTEVKKPTVLSMLWESGKGDLCLNLDHNNLGGRCISGMLYTKSLESILLGVAIPDHRTGILYSFKCIIGARSIKSSYFEPSGLIDFFVDSASGYKYSDPGHLSDALKGAIEQDPSAPVRQSGSGLKIASNWDYSKKESRPILDKYFSFTSMCGIPLLDGSRITFGLNVKNSTLKYVSDDPKTRKYKVRETKMLKQESEEDIGYRSWSDFSEDEKLDLLISGYKKKNGKELDEQEVRKLLTEKAQADLKEIYSLGEIERIYCGTGLSPALKPAISEKIEFSPIIEYRKTFFLPRFSQSNLTVSGKLSPIFGTTNALKTQVMLDMQIPINHLLLLDLDYIIGWSLNSHYLDNFRSNELGLCESMGPVEMYNFTELGGKFMTRFKARLFLILEIDPILIIYPNISLSWGGLSNSGIKACQMDKSILKVRKWPDNTIDIAQNDFHSVVILSPGVRVKLGPLMLGFKLNSKLSRNHDFNLVRPVDIEFGFQL